MLGRSQRTDFQILAILQQLAALHVQYHELEPGVIQQFGTGDLFFFTSMGHSGHAIYL
jgi:hypothetical protein